MAKKNKLVELMARQVVLGDGATGTMFYQYGVFINSCFEQLNISNPKLVKRVHDSYVRAGVDFIETNTFGANEYKLAKYGLAEQFEKINIAGVEIARESAAEDTMVAGAMGPLGEENLTQSQTKEAFLNQAKILIEAGVDFIILETFSNTKEIMSAIKAIGEISDLPIVAQMTSGENNKTASGEKIEDAIKQISAEKNVVAAGLNCSLGPAQMLKTIELIGDAANKPIAVQPNIGPPRWLEDRMLYMCTPEYMAEYAKRFFEKGVKIIGGCCGTTPEHIKEIVRTVRSLDKAAMPKTTAIKKTVSEVACEQMVPLAKKSRFGAKLAKGEKVTTIEITPPCGVDLSKVLEKAKLCDKYGIDAINIPDGPRASLRLSPMITAIKIAEYTNVEPILHCCCRDRNLIGMQSDMLGAAAAGLNNVLIITGDPPKLGDYPDATGVFDLDSVAMTEVVKNLNCGMDIGGNNFSPTAAICIGVGANPVAADLPREIKRFRQKVAAGAEFAITQPVFDADTLFEFIESIEAFKIPVIAGIWPLISFRNAEFMANEVPGVVVPESVLERMSKTKTGKEAKMMGIQIAKEMLDKISDVVAGFAVSAPLGNVKIALAALGKIGIDEI